MVASGKRLHNVFGDSFGGFKSSPYVVCHVHGKKDAMSFTTPTVKQDVSPTWNFPGFFKFKNFDGCDSLRFDVFHDSGTGADAAHLGQGVIVPEDIAVGLHRIPLHDEAGQPCPGNGELKIRILSVPKLQRIVARKSEREREEVMVANSSEDNAMPRVGQAAGVCWGAMNPAEKYAILQQKEALRTERRRAKSERRRLREDALAVTWEEVLRLREEVAGLRAEKERVTASALQSPAGLNLQTTEVAGQQADSSAAHLQQPGPQGSPVKQLLASQETKLPCVDSAVVAGGPANLGLASTKPRACAFSGARSLPVPGLCHEPGCVQGVPEKMTAAYRPAVQKAILQHSLGELQRVISSLV